MRGLGHEDPADSGPRAIDEEPRTDVFDFAMTKKIDAVFEKRERGEALTAEEQRLLANSEAQWDAFKDAEHADEKSALPERYKLPTTSTFKLTVKEGANEFNVELKKD